MNEIIDNLYLSGVNDILIDQLSSSIVYKNHIKRIVSIGVQLDLSKDNNDNAGIVNNLVFPNVMDSPDQSIVSTIRKCLPFIDEGLNIGEPVLVHCVYGQSRSASIVAAYLVLYRNFSITDALELIKTKRQNICVNPGFLCQLMCLSSSYGLNDPYIRLIEYNETRICNNSALTLDGQTATRGYHCKICKILLFTCKDLITDVSFESFLGTHLDSFWKGFRPPTFASESSSCKPRISSVQSIRGHTVLAPLSWITDQVSEKLASRNAAVTRNPHEQVDINTKASLSEVDENKLSCHSCGATCGYFEKKGLLLCNGYIAADLFAIRDSSVRKRILQ